MSSAGLERGSQSSGFVSGDKVKVMSARWLFLFWVWRGVKAFNWHSIVTDCGYRVSAHKFSCVVICCGISKSSAYIRYCKRDRCYQNSNCCISRSLFCVVLLCAFGELFWRPGWGPGRDLLYFKIFAWKNPCNFWYSVCLLAQKQQPSSACNWPQPRKVRPEIVRACWNFKRNKKERSCFCLEFSSF